MNHLSIIRNGLLLFALGVALVASTYRLSEAPAIWYDEGFYLQMSMHMAESGNQVLQTAPGVFSPASYVSVGYPLIAPIAFAYKLFGVGVLQARFVMVVFILGLIAVTYLLTKRLFGAWSATLTTLLLASFPMLYGNGKSVLGEVPGLFYFSLTLLALYKLEQSTYRDWRWYTAVGIAVGLCAATKPFFILALAALFFTLIFKWRKISLNWYGVAAGSAALFMCLSLWVFLQFGSDASIQSILIDYSNPYATQDLGALILQNALRFVKESTPLYTLGMLVVWSFSLWLRRKKQTISSPEMAAYIFCVLTLLSYLRLAGWYRYLFPATTVALIFFPAAILSTWEWFASRIPRITSHVRWAPYAIVILLSLAQVYQTAFSSYVAQYYTATRTHDMSTTLQTISPEKKVFLYNVPELAILLPSKNYYQYLTPLPRIEIGSSALPTLTKGEADLVIVDSDIYTKNPDVFAKYHVQKQVDRYEILQKR